MAVLTRNKSNIYGLVSDLTTLTNSISAETTRATGVEGSLASLTTTDKSSLVNAINEIDSKLGSEASGLVEAETTRALAAEGVLQTNIDNEITRATASEGVLTTNLSAEITRATGAENALDTRIDILESGVMSGVFWKASYDILGDLETALTSNESTIEAGWAYYVKSTNDGYVVVNDTDGDYIPATWTTKSLIKFADYTELSGLVSAETTRALAAEGVLTTNLNAEITRATTAENDIKTELDNTQTGAGLSTTGAYSADNTTNYISDATSLKDADKKLDTAIKTLSDNVYTKVETDDKIRLGGAVFITETLTVTSDLITLTNTPKNGVIFNFATVRHVDSNFVSWDIPVTVTATIGGKEFLLSPDSSGQFDTKSVMVQYAYIPTV